MTAVLEGRILRTENFNSSAPLMNPIVFEAFCGALEHRDVNVRILRATAFWEKLGEVEAAEMSIDSLAYAQSIGMHSAADLLSHAAELGYTADQICNAASHAAR